MTDAEQMIDLMRYASQSKVAAALGVSKTTTGQWAKGHDVTPYRVRQVRDLLRPPTPQEAAPPEWVKRLLAGTMALEAREAITDVELATAQAKAAAHLAVSRQRQPRRADDDGASVTNA